MNRSMRMMAQVCIVVLSGAALAGAAGCAKHEERPASTLTEAQRDSVLARSAIPGAGAVGRAQQAAGAEAGHAATVDSATK